MRLTAEQAAAHQARIRAACNGTLAEHEAAVRKPSNASGSVPRGGGLERGQSLETQPIGKAATHPRGMNKLESRYAAHLELLKRAGEIKWYAFEAIRLRLASGAWFKPDFVVIRRGDLLEIHETKGFMREAANVRLKVAADRFPFLFYVVKWEGGKWVRRALP